MATKTPLRIQRSFRTIGDRFTVARKLQRITAAQLADRAGISVPTLRNLERGEGTSSLETFLRVARVLGILDQLEKALDPFETEVGRLRSEERLPIRVRQKAQAKTES